MKKVFVIFLMFPVYFSAGVVYGEGFTGDGSVQGQAVTVNEPVTIAGAKNLPRNSWVILTGYIVSALPGGKHYTFRDSTGEITVEIEWDVWRGVSAGPSDTVTIYGCIKSKRGQACIEVEAITAAAGVKTGKGKAVTITRPVTVAEAKDLPGNSWVVLTGNIIRPLRDKFYIFRDSTGEITVEIDKEVWRGLSAGPSDTVEIGGEIETEKSRTFIEVKVVRKM